MARKKAKRRFLIYSLLSLSILAYLAVFGYKYWSDILSNNKETKELEAKYQSLLEEEQELNSEVTKLQDEEYVAKYAGEKYMYSKDGEYIIKIAEKDKSN